jgi:hypothetical protein
VRTTTDTLPQSLHQIHHVLSTRTCLRGKRLAASFWLMLNESRFVLVLEPVRLEVARLLIDDVPGEIEHVLCDLDVLMSSKYPVGSRT